MEETLIIVLCDGPVHKPGRGRDSVFGLHWHGHLATQPENVEQSLEQPDKRVVVSNDGIATSRPNGEVHNVPCSGHRWGQGLVLGAVVGVAYRV